MTRVYTRTEIDALIAAASLRDALICRTLLSCGLRAHELCGLTVADAIGPNGPRDDLRLRVHKGSANHNGPQSVPLPKSLGSDLARYANGRRPSSPLFPAMDGERLTRWGLYKLWQRLCVRAGVDRRPVHATRHTFISTMLDKGVNLVTARDMARHASIATTNRYAHSTPSAMAKAAAAVEV